MRVSTRRRSCYVHEQAWDRSLILSRSVHEPVVIGTADSSGPVYHHNQYKQPQREKTELKQAKIDCGVSIVCVYNDPSVLNSCLKKSIDAYSGKNSIDFVPVDNTRHAFASAGSALNFGARQSLHGLVVFAHQDVYLHSIDRLVEVGALFNGTDWGLLGANGMTNDGVSIGRMRDRVRLIGIPAPDPAVVDSLDEVVFVVPRDLVLRHPITEDPELAWHAYAVEYGLRLRSLGKQVGAVDLAVTHNSLTINLDKLDVAHRHVGERYPAQLPMWTTCGPIGSVKSRLREIPAIREHGWRLLWLRQSLIAARIQRIIHAPAVLSDLSHDVDSRGFSDDSPLHVFNMDRDGDFINYSPDSLVLWRNARPVVMQSVRTAPDLIAALRDIPNTARVLVTDLGLDDFRAIGSDGVTERDWLVGIQPGSLWLLGGPDVRTPPDEWSRAKSVPLRSGALAGRETS